MERIIRHTDFDVYKKAFDLGMRVFRYSKEFPVEERYSLVDQIRRASRSVCGNLAEAWRKRNYEAAFINKLTESEAEAAEAQVWLQFAIECDYLDRTLGLETHRAYDEVIAMLVTIKNHPSKWVLK